MPVKAASYFDDIIACRKLQKQGGMGLFQLKMRETSMVRASTNRTHHIMNVASAILSEVVAADDGFVPSYFFFFA